MNRKQRRAMEKMTKKQKTQAVADKMLMFDKLPEECSACDKSYDKNDKQMATTWNVVVREEENVVRLYCPDCWQMANEAIQVLKRELEDVST